jgi:selenide,water dikinase
VTGFGLLGHAHEMAERERVRIELDARRCRSSPARLRAGAGGVRTGGDRRNRDFAAAARQRRTASPTDVLALAYDPQTSGGLLGLAARGQGAVLQAEFASRKLFACRVGRVVEGSGVSLR